jgi:starch phosphorylase
MRRIIDSLASGEFSNGDAELFAPIVSLLLRRDEYLLLADYQSYVECQERVSSAYRDREQWTRKSILNAARCGFFSSDRTIREYCRDIWKATPVTVE